MRYGPFLLIGLELLAALAPLRAQDSPSPKCREHGRGIRICTELDEGALSRPGRSTTWRIWVEGDAGPIQVRLHNDSPAVVRVKGGADQVVHMGCRLHRRIKRKVVSIGRGAARLTARPYSASPRQEAATIAASLAPLLARIEAEFIERRKKLPLDPDSRAVAVTELLDSVEAQLMRVLGYEELTALRDYVREKFRQARASREQTGAGVGTSDPWLPFAPRAVLASVGALLPAISGGAQGQAPARAASEPVLDRIQKLLRRLFQLADGNDLVTSLCVTSAPGDRAKFLMRPQAIKRWTAETITVGYLPAIYRGLYVYKMSKGFKTKNCENPEREECALMDLVDDRQPIFHCDLAANACRWKDSPLPPTCNG